MYDGLLQLDCFKNLGQGQYTSDLTDQASVVKTDVYDTPESQEDVQEDVPSPENNPEGQKDEEPGKDMPIWI